MKFLPLVLAGLKRKKLRTALTFLSVFVAFMLYAYLGAIQVALSGGVEMAGQDRLIAGHKVSMIQTLPQSYLGRIKAVPGVSAVIHQTWFGGIYQDPKNFFGTFPVDPEGLLEMFPKRFVLTDAEKQAWLSTRTGAIIGRQLAKRFNWKIGSRIPIQSPIWGQPAGMTQWEFEVVGIYGVEEKNADETSLFFRYDYFEEARQKNKGQVGWYLIRVSDPEKSAEIATAIDREFENSPYETKTQAEGAMAKAFAQQIGDIGTIVMAVVSAVFFTILLVAGNAMAQSVRERTSELGVLKAMGFTNLRVLVLVLVESCLIAILGGLGGLGLAWLSLLGGSPVPDVLPILYLPQPTLATGAILALLLGLAAGALPAWQAMSLRISEALRRGG